MSPVRPTIQYSFGPGGMTPAVKWILIVNVGVFLVTLVSPQIVLDTLGLTPTLVLGRLQIWQLVTYLFVHSPTQWSHILFNMFSVWMFGVELERRWGTRGFLEYYFATGVGAGVSMILVSLLPFDDTRLAYYTTTIGASGAVYGLLMAWGILFPHRQLLFMMIFPVTARVFVTIMGAIAFLLALTASGGPVANVAHLGGLLVGYLFLKGPRNLQLNLRYYWTKWRMERMRRKFNVHKGGKNNWGDKVH
jgi:membrane associated rhomboid family serine protease